MYYFKKLPLLEIKRFEKLTTKLKKNRVIKQKEQLFFLDGT
jgi:hypothetical protein